MSTLDFPERVRAISVLRRAYDGDLAALTEAVIRERRASVESDADIMVIARAHLKRHLRARCETCALETLLVSWHRDAWAAADVELDPDTFAVRAYWALLFDLIEELRTRGENLNELGTDRR